MERLRNHLEATQHEKRDEIEEIEATAREVNHNVLMTIDRRKRKEHAQQVSQSEKFDPSHLIPKCCAPLPLMVRNRSAETPSTRSETIEFSENSSILLSESGSISMGDYCDVHNVAIFTQEFENEKEILRGKLDILTERCNGKHVSLSDHHTSTDWHTDTEADEELLSPSYCMNNETFSQSNGEDLSLNDFENERDYNFEKRLYSSLNIKAQNGSDGEVRNEKKYDRKNDGPSQLKTELYRREKYIGDDRHCVKNANERIFIVRSEYSAGDDSSDNGSSHRETHDTNANPSQEQEPPSLVSATLKSDSYLSSATFSQDWNDLLEQMEEVTRHSIPMEIIPVIEEEKMDFGEKYENIQPETKSKENLMSVLGNVLEVGENMIKISEKDGNTHLKDKTSYSTSREKSSFHPDIAEAIKSIGKALEIVSSDNKEIECPSGNKEIECASGNKADCLESMQENNSSEPLLMSSVSLTTVPSKQDHEIFQNVGLLYKIPYIQRSFAAAAPLLLHDLKWMRILRKLMPEAHAKAIAQMESVKSEENTRVIQIMKWAENNPVVAAYGLLTNNYSYLAVSQPGISSVPTPITSNHESSAAGVRGGWNAGKTRALSQINIDKLPPLEWCIFLDPKIVTELNEALMARDKSHAKDDREKAQVEVKKQVSRLFTRLVLSHGSIGQIAAEAIGIPQSYTFESMVNAFSEECHEGRGLWSCKTTTYKGSAHSSTGIFATTWMSIFSAAIHLGCLMSNRGGDNIDLQECLESGRYNIFSLVEERSRSLFESFIPCVGFPSPDSSRTDHGNNSFGESAVSVSDMLGGPLHLVLNVMTRRVPPGVIGELVDFMTDNSIVVDAVSSFDMKELRPIAESTSLSLKTYHLLHSAGDLQKACHAGEIRYGDNIFFNAASLIKTDQNPLNAFVFGQDEFNDEMIFAEYALPKDTLQKSKRKCKATIEDYKMKFNLNIGCYIQEWAVDAKKYACIVEFFKKYSCIYNLGLSFGGINGKFIIGSTGDGFSRQRIMGRIWDPTVKPLYAMEPLSLFDNQSIQKAVCAGSWGYLGTINTGGKSWL